MPVEIEFGSEQTVIQQKFLLLKIVSAPVRENIFGRGQILQQQIFLIERKYFRQWTDLAAADISVPD